MTTQRFSRSPGLELTRSLLSVTALLVVLVAAPMQAAPMKGEIRDLEIAPSPTAQGFFLSAAELPGSFEFDRSSLRIVGPDSSWTELTEGSEEPLFAPEEPLEEGTYHWEAIYSRRDGAEEYVTVARSSGSFEVIRGALVFPVEATIRAGNEPEVAAESRDEQPSELPEGWNTKAQAATHHFTGGLSVTGNGCVGSSGCTAAYNPGDDFEIVDTTGDAVLRLSDGTSTIPRTFDWFVLGNTTDESFRIVDFQSNNLVPTLTLSQGAPGNSLFLSEAGRLGLGTAAPSGDLHIQATSGSSELWMTPATGSTWRFWNGSAGMWLSDMTVGTTPVKVNNGAPSDTFVVQSTGNIGLGTQTPAATMEIEGVSGTSQFLIDEKGADASVEVMFNLVCNCSPGFRMQNTVNGATWFFRHTSAGDFSFDNVGSAGLEARLDSNGNFFIQGSLSQGSSRTLKENLEPANGEEVLEVLSALDLYEWSYTDQETRHFGPMAEDFFDAFGLGAHRERLAPGDVAGLALAAIKALRAENEGRLERLEAENAALRSAVEKLLSSGR